MTRVNDNYIIRINENIGNSKMTYYYNQTAYELATDPLWDTPEMTEVELKVALLPADKLAMVEQEAEDLGCGCTLEQAYISLIETGELRG